MMNTKLRTQSLETGTIAVMSNVSSVNVVGTKVSRVEEVPGHEAENPSTIHVDFKVQNPRHLETVLESAEELGMILNLEDAVELGLLLVAMGLEHKTPDDIAAVMSRLSKLVKEFE